jgi:hypothetical protein
MSQAALQMTQEAAVTALIKTQLTKPYARIAMWPNDRRRTGTREDGRAYNDPHMNTKVRINTLRLSDLVAEALAKGDVEVEILGGAWTNDDLSDNRPAISGTATISRYEVDRQKAEKDNTTSNETADTTTDAATA